MGPSTGASGNYYYWCLTNPKIEDPQVQKLHLMYLEG